MNMIWLLWIYEIQNNEIIFHSNIVVAVSVAAVQALSAFAFLVSPLDKIRLYRFNKKKNV